MSNALRRVTSLVDITKSDSNSKSASTEMKLSEDFSHIYILKSPNMYYW